MATVLEGKYSRTSQGLSNNFSRPIPAIFCQVVLMMETLESNSFTFLMEIKQNNMADFSKGLQITYVTEFA